ncbi:ABC transporter permease [Falsirhodobacter xinxiangensis]|uniref:ABC transporter permease n=1 Tax=Falsirhodobacter xinxiangensis TaxID=2530049 RepID=UPI0010AB3CB5|nr:ABC transporter permease [Rhodobacter xinxiangensis]
MTVIDHPLRARPKRRPLRDPFLLLPLLVLLAVAVMAISAPWLFPGDPLDMVAMPYLWPLDDPAFPLGTDSLGRDLTAGLFHGARATLLVGISSAALCLGFGTLIGAAAGYLGGRTDLILMRVTEIFQTMPTMLLVIVLLAISDPSLTLIVVAIGLASWPMVARLARAEFITLRHRDFVLAARALGYGPFRIVFIEILPNALPTLIVATSVLIANGILIESAVSFLNLGDANTVTWGSLIGAGRTQIRTEWYLSAIPGIAIILTVLAVNFLGDRLTRILNPRLRA